MSINEIIFTVGPNYTLLCRMPPPGKSQWVFRQDRQMDGQRDGRQTFILCFPLLAAT